MKRKDLKIMHDLNELELASVIGGSYTYNAPTAIAQGGTVINSGGVVVGQTNYQYGNANAWVSTWQSTYNGYIPLYAYYGGY